MQMLYQGEKGDMVLLCRKLSRVFIYFRRKLSLQLHLYIPFFSMIAGDFMRRIGLVALVSIMFLLTCNHNPLSDERLFAISAVPVQWFNDHSVEIFQVGDWTSIYCLPGNTGRSGYGRKRIGSFVPLLVFFIHVRSRRTISRSLALSGEMPTAFACSSSVVTNSVNSL